MPQPSLGPQPHSFRLGGLRGLALGFGLVLALLAGMFTFLVGMMGWFLFGLLRLVTSPFRSRPKPGSKRASAGDRSRPFIRVHRVGRRSHRTVDARATRPAAKVDPKRSPIAPDQVEDADFEEIP